MVPELRVRLGPYTSRFPAGEEGQSWQRGKPGLVEIGFPSLVGLQPQGHYFFSCALLHGCARAGGADLAPC